MKTLFVSLVALLFAFFLGCQSSITDPVMNDSNLSTLTEQQNSTNKDWISSLPGEIEIREPIEVPGVLIDEFATIEGQIKYAVEEFYTDTPPSVYKVSLYINAHITCSGVNQENIWLVKNTSEDVVYKSSNNENVTYLEKTFNVLHACPAPLEITFKFEVSGKDLKLVSMKLTEVEILRVKLDDPT